MKKKKKQLILPQIDIHIKYNLHAPRGDIIAVIDSDISVTN